MSKEIQQIELSNDPLVWDKLKAKEIALLVACEEWISGSNKIHPLIGEMPTNIDLRIGHWQLMPIYGKSSDSEFFRRMANGLFNINARLRPMDRLELQTEPDLWHDLWNHTPLLVNEEISHLMRSMALVATMSKDSVFTKQVGNLWWSTFEFGGILENNRVVAYGAGILSSRQESLEFMNVTTKHREFDLSEILETKYPIEGFQDTYWILKDWNQLREAVIKLWSYIN